MQPFFTIILSVNQTRSVITFFLLCFVALLAIIWLRPFRQENSTFSDMNVTSNTASLSPSSTTSPTSTGKGLPHSLVQHLDTPWEIVFLPDQSLLVTQRAGQLLHILPNNDNSAPIVIPVAGVKETGESGLLGLVLDPNFAQNQYLYLYATIQNGNQLENQVMRFRFQNDQLLDTQIILRGIAAASNHDGGRLAFGPDGYLYITTGDADNAASAQDTQSLNGKILRIGADGSLPSDNPFQNAIYSYGHRNVQGLAWDEQGNLWATEHGRSGASTGYDEVNLIEKGQNYGWPTIQGDQSAAGMKSPLLQSGANTPWAPASLLYFQNALYFTGLRGARIYRLPLTGNGQIGQLTEYLVNEYGRLRTLKLGPDGYFYLLTSNRDGRGQAKSEDDQIIQLAPTTLLPN